MNPEGNHARKPKENGMEKGGKPSNYPIGNNMDFPRENYK
jgi:hypothetical protein